MTHGPLCCHTCLTTIDLSPLRVMAVTANGAADDDAVLAEARALAAEAQRARKFTDTSAFTLRCLVCQCGL